MPLQVQRLRLDELQPDPRNARRHNERNLETIAASLREFGQRRPIVITPDRIIIAGNGTAMAAKRLGWEEIEATVIDIHDEDQLRAFAIADNRSADLADWNESVLLETLRTLSPDLQAAAGFSEDDLRALTADPTGDPADIGKAEQSGVRQQESVNDRSEKYEASGERTIVLEYPKERLEALTEQLEAYRVRLGYTSNSEAVASLIARKTGAEAPDHE